MVMSSQQKDFIFNVSVPYKGLMVKPGTQETLVHLTPTAPVQRVNTFVVASKLFFKLMVDTVPETDVTS